MGMRRMTRLTNASSKKAENLAVAVSLHFFHYNFARPHASLANPYPRTPAMAAGVADHIWALDEIASLLEPAPTGLSPLETGHSSGTIAPGRASPLRAPRL